MKKSVKAFWGMALIFVLLTGLLSACSNDDGASEEKDTTATNEDKKDTTDTKDDSSDSTDTTDTTDTEDEVIEITILSGTITEGVEGELEQAMADAYMEQNPNVTITFIGTPSNELTKKMTAYVANGDVPDAFSMIPDFFPKAIELGILEDIRPYLSDDYYNDFLQHAVDDCTHEGELLRFPWFSVPTAVIYRTDWLEETGLGIPQTWEDFTEVAKAMTIDSDGDGNIDRWGFSMVGTNNGSGTSRFMNIARSFGCEDAKFVDGEWSTTIDTPEFREALQYFTDLHTVHGVVPPGPTEAGYTEAVNYLATENTGMMVTGSNGMGLLMTKNPDLEGKLGSFLLPERSAGVGVSAGVIGYSVSSQSEHKEVVIDYLKFMNDPENAINFAQKTGRLPIRKESTTAAIFEEPTYKGFIMSLEKVYVPEKYPQYQQMVNSIGLAYTDIMANDVSVDDAMDDIMASNEEQVNEANSN